MITSRVNLWRGGPFKPLTEGFAKTGGRNNRGVITSRHIGGGHRKVYRLIDWWRAEGTAPGVVERVEYDPNRSARIALVRHEPAAGAGGEASTAGSPNAAAAHRSGCSYMLAPQGVEAGDAVRAGPGSPIRPGCALPLSDIPVGTAVHNVELRPGKGGQLARAAGTSCTLVKKGERPAGARGGHGRGRGSGAAAPCSPQGALAPTGSPRRCASRPGSRPPGPQPGRQPPSQPALPRTLAQATTGTRCCGCLRASSGWC